MLKTTNWIEKSEYTLLSVLTSFQECYFFWGGKSTNTFVTYWISFIFVQLGNPDSSTSYKLSATGWTVFLKYIFINLYSTLTPFFFFSCKTLIQGVKDYKQVYHVFRAVPVVMATTGEIVVRWRKTNKQTAAVGVSCWLTTGNPTVIPASWRITE